MKHCISCLIYYIIHSCVCQQIVSKSITEYKQKRKYISVKGYQKDIEEMKISENGLKFIVCQRIVSGQTGLTKLLALKLGAKLKFLSNC